MPPRRTLISAVAAIAMLALAAPPAARGQDLLVTTDWLAERLSEANVTILHVATDRTHYDKGHIPGARFVAWKDLTAPRAGVPNELPPVADLVRLFERLGVGDDGRIVIYGDQKGLSAARAFFTLDYLGHGRRAAVLDGGLEKWRAEHRPVSTDVPSASARSFFARVSPGVVVGLDAVRDISWTATNQTPAPWVLIDARPAAQFSGAEPGEGIRRPGHIPGARNIFWEQHLTGGDVPVLKSVAELRALYASAGATPGAPVVTYCRTGGQASHAYFVAKYLGYDVKMYDGSFIEWSRAEGTEVIGR